MGKEDSVNKGRPDGYAPLDVAGLVPVANLPSGATTPTGTGFRHITINVEDVIVKLVENIDVHAAAGIVESKLALNNPTHPNTVSGPNLVLGRVSAGAGAVEEISCTSAGRELLDDANAAAQRATLGLGTSATSDLAAVAPENVTKAAAAIGVGTTVARVDHKHDISTAAAGASAPSDAAAEGAATSLARSDHQHSREAFGTAAGTICQGNDARLSDTRTPTDNTVTTAKIVANAVTASWSGVAGSTAINNTVDITIIDLTCILTAAADVIVSAKSSVGTSAAGTRKPVLKIYRDAVLLDSTNIQSNTNTDRFGITCLGRAAGLAAATYHFYLKCAKLDAGSLDCNVLENYLVVQAFYK